MDTEKLDALLQKVLELSGTYGLKLLGAIVVLILGLWIIKIIVRSTGKAINRRVDDPSLSGFLRSFIGILLKTLLVVSIMSMIGIQMTSFIAILGAAGLAIGLALSGYLQNFAGGAMLLIFKPFKAGDFIEATGHMGTVKEIQIFYTILNTPDNKIITIPNGKLYAETITNFTAAPTRRVEFIFGIGYESNIDLAREILLDILNNNDKVLEAPAPFIGLKEMADSSVNLVARVWVNTPDFWNVYFDTNEQVFKAFNEKGINIPFPQMDVHIKNQK